LITFHQDMEDFLLELLLMLLEFVLEIVAEALMDLGLRAIARFFNAQRFENPWFAAIAYILLGTLMGGVSLMLFPHPIMHPSKIHGISLMIGPMLAGLVMSVVGSMLRRRDKEVTQLESFRYGFTFAFGMALVRFLFAR
jgi:RsiW-degrading membrane proteinase PrsW (M82 family)